jgi:hypothetical protein
LCETKTRPAFGEAGPGNGRNLETFGCYLFFLAFFFAGMFCASCLGVAKFAVEGQELWPTRPTPQYVVACAPFVKRNLQIICSGKNPNRVLTPEAAGGLALSFS